MTAGWICRMCFGCMLFPVFCAGQFQPSSLPQGEKIDTDEALQRALKNSSLTYQGKPFHAVEEIGTAGAEYSGRVEVWWVDQTKFHLLIRSPHFEQERTVNGSQVFEKNTGDYYPRWLENFVLALLDPLPTIKNFQGRGGEVTVGSTIARSCVRRDDRLDGITDQMTWGDVCFSGSEPKLLSVQALNFYLKYSDWKAFDKKQIARTYSTDVLDYKPVVARLTTLEEYKHPDEGLFAVSAATPAENRVETTYVSTPKEESMIEIAPTIAWPPVREGRTEGYMIVYARTDRTGQVRETAKHNSDQPGLESFGMEQALRYKFKPLVVDGVARQMEMPLVLHFRSILSDPIPILTVDQMKSQLVGCQDPGSGSNSLTVRVSVNETGKYAGMNVVAGAIDGQRFIAASHALEHCSYLPYAVNGKATYYKGDVEVKVP